MNTSIIRYIVGYIIKLEGIFLLLPCIIALSYQEKEGFIYLIMGILCYITGSALT